LPGGKGKRRKSKIFCAADSESPEADAQRGPHGQFCLPAYTGTDDGESGVRGIYKPLIARSFTSNAQTMPFS
jgi:hypothetical protein